MRTLRMSDASAVVMMRHVSEETAKSNMYS